MGGLGDCLIAMGLGRTTLWGLAVESLLANALWEILVSCVPCGLSKDRLVWGGPHPPMPLRIKGGFRCLIQTKVYGVIEEEL